MQLDHHALRVIVAGQSGMGKSTFLVKFLQGARATCKFIFDPEGEFSLRLKRRPARTAADLVSAVQNGFVIYDPSTMFPGRAGDGFNFFAKWAWKVSEKIPGRKIFACDEFQRWSNTGGGGICEGLSLVLESGRRYGLDSILVTLAANAIHNRVRGAATEIIAFRTIEPRPLEWLSGQGFDPEELKALEKGIYVARVSGKQQATRGRVF